LITLRKPVTDDAWIYRLIQEELIPLSHYEAESLLKKDLSKRLSNGKTYVSRSEKGTCTGFIHVVSKKESYWVDMLAVRPRYQGKGIGQRLMRVAERLARRNGKDRVSLFVNSGNQGGIRFYQRNGYRIMHYEQSADCYLMEKKLKLI